MNDHQINGYLTRMGIYEVPETSDRGLHSLHRAHLYSIPFEDLDIHTGTPLVLSVDHLYEKVVTHHRGGFCYELNYLFGKLLEELGFEVEYLAAQVFGEDEEFGSLYDHLALRVDKKWLSDVGFGGGSFINPLIMDEPGIQEDPGGKYRIKSDPQGLYKVLRNSGDQGLWKPLYQFDLTPRSIHEFESECVKKQTNKDSHFVKNKICTLATPEGRKTILNGEFSVRTQCDKSTTRIESTGQEAEILK